MTSCDRFEREGLLLLERELPLDGHFESCPDCRASRAAHERLRRGLGVLGAGAVPRADWQGKVWRRIDERRRPSRWLVPAALAAAALAAAALVVLGVALRPEGARPASLEVAVAAGDGATRRGEQAHPGDLLTVRATTAGARHAELRIYFHETRILVRCSSRPPCRRDGDEIRAELTLEAIGSYQTLLLLSDRPLREPASDLDGDAGAALAAGARAILGRDVDVR